MAFGGGRTQHHRAGLVPAVKAGTDTATTLSGQFQIPKPASKYQSGLNGNGILNVLNIGI